MGWNSAEAIRNMTIRRHVNASWYHEGDWLTGPIISSHRSDFGSTVSMVGRSNCRAVTAVYACWTNSTEAMPSVTVTYRKPDSSTVTATVIVSQNHTQWDGESSKWLHWYCGIFEATNISEMNRVTMSSGSSFYESGCAFTWLENALPAINTQSIYVSGNDYTFTDETEEYGVFQIAATTRGVDSGTAIPASNGPQKTYTGHWWLPLTPGVKTGGIQDYYGSKPFWCVSAFYEPAKYGLPMVTVGR